MNGDESVRFPARAEGATRRAERVKTAVTSTVNAATRAFLDSAIYETLSFRVDAVAAALFVALLVEHEVLSAYFASSGRVRLQALRITVAPLLVGFVLIVVARTTGLR